jgi:hypothetical protein
MVETDWKVVVFNTLRRNRSSCHGILAGYEAIKEPKPPNVRFDRDECRRPEVRSTKTSRALRTEDRSVMPSLQMDDGVRIALH